jgi:L-ascorbate metabolism protein UlaG (beta-lactamase superfamily)
MFDIEYKGANAVVITTKKSFLVADPKLSLVGLKDLAVKNAIEVVTEPRFLVNSDDLQLLVEGPGEYEVGDFSIRGLSANRHIDTEGDEKKATIYRIEVNDVRIALIGNIASRMDEDKLEELGIIDILILPIGGAGYTLDATSAAALVRQIDPKAVVPVHYADSNIKYEVPQDTLETFTKELGASVETVAKYKIKGSSSLPPVLTIIEVLRG